MNTCEPSECESFRDDHSTSGKFCDPDGDALVRLGHQGITDKCPLIKKIFNRNSSSAYVCMHLCVKLIFRIKLFAHPPAPTLPSCISLSLSRSSLTQRRRDSQLPKETIHTLLLHLLPPRNYESERELLDLTYTNLVIRPLCLLALRRRGCFFCPTLCMPLTKGFHNTNNIRTCSAIINLPCSSFIANVSEETPHRNISLISTRPGSVVAAFGR